MANGRSVQPYHELRTKNNREGQRFNEDSGQLYSRRPVAPVRASLPNGSPNWRPISVSFREAFSLADMEKNDLLLLLQY
jgi:hypothetical protein